MLLHELFQLVHGFKKCFLLLIAVSDGMSRHRDSQYVPLSFDHWVDFFQPRGSNWSLEIIFSLAILEGEQTLADWIAVADLAIVDKSDVFVPPRKQVPRHLAAKRPGPKKEALGALADFQIEFRHHAPLHQLEVQTDCLLGKTGRVHLFFKLNANFAKRRCLEVYCSRHLGLFQCHYNALLKLDAIGKFRQLLPDQHNIELRLPCLGKVGNHVVRNQLRRQLG